MPRLVFFGSDEIALPCLEHIVASRPSGIELVALYSQPDRPTGRGQKLQPNAVVRWAQERGLPVFQPPLLDETAPVALRELGCELALVMAYGQILKRDLLDVPPLGFFNLHASLLPPLRGAAPIEGAIVGGLATSGVSLQRVVPRLDAGPVVDAESVPLDAGETRWSLREKIAAASVPLIARALPRIVAGAAAGVPQDESAVTFTRKITREDSAVDFRAPAREIAARVRALSPWPGVVVPHGDLLLKIGAATAEPFNGTDGTDGATAPIAGTLLSADGTGVRIATGDGVLNISELQRPTAKMLPVAAFLAGFPLPDGTVFASKPMPPLVRVKAQV
jgi:methionyl-tRNA formyltransferase